MYKVLDKAQEEIRLISLLDPSPKSAGKQLEPGSDNDTVKCHLWHFSMKDMRADEKVTPVPLIWDPTRLGDVLDGTAPQPLTYVALSYTWGSPADTTLIEVNGEQWVVRKNLEAALRALREKRLLHQGCAVWVDALCINQNDLLERREEVGRMRSIYKDAKAVAMWLGEEGNDGAQAIWLIRLLSESFRSGTSAQLAHSLRIGASSIPTGAWKALADFMERPYWSRVWILQEVAMGDRSTPILCGRHMLTWGELFDALYGFTSAHIDVVFSCLDRSKRGNPGLRRNHIIQLNFQQQMQMKLKAPQLLPIIDVARQCLVSDDRDRVYGILGMMAPEITKRTMVDYTISIARAYRSFAEVVILSRQDLLILEECTWPPIPRTPSWVPDWTHEEHHRLFGGGPTYNAANSTLRRLHIDSVEGLLRCEGIALGTIDGMGATYHENDKSNVSTDSLRQPRNNRSPYDTSHKVRTAIWQVLVGNRTPTGSVAPETYECLLQCDIAMSTGDNDDGVSWRGRRTLSRLLRANRELHIGDNTLGSFFCPVTHTEPDPIALRDALERMFRFWRPRRLLITQEGRLGAGPAATLPGDEVFALCGSTVPVVLRPFVSGAYKVVGCCYMQDFMEGEALRGVQEGALMLRDVAIC